MAVSKLGLRDLNNIRQELQSVREKWLDIGMELNQVSPTELRKIAENHKQDYSTCLNLMLMQWLESGDAGWKILCEVLKSSTVNESDLSKELLEKHCSGTTESKKLSGPISKPVKRANSDDTTGPKAKRSKSTPLPTSFPPEDFVRPQPPNRICYRCRQIPRTPLRPECCNIKLYCEHCSLKVKMCSTHQMENKFKRDDKLFTLIPQIKIKCPNWKEGCEFKETVSKVHRKHLPECTKSKKGEHVTPDYQVGTKGGTTIEPDSKETAVGDNEEEVWYVASEEIPPHNATSANVTTPAKPKAPVPHKDTPLPYKKPKPDVNRQGLPLSAQQQSKPSAHVQSPVQPQKSLGSCFVPEQEAKYSIDRFVTPKFYDAQQPVKSEQQQIVRCKYKGNGCVWTGELAKLIQHVSVCQYNPANSQIKVKTEIKQEPHIPPTTLQMHTTKTQSYVKKEPSSPRGLLGSDMVSQPCEYKAIGCKEMIARGRMKQHLQESVQHHLDLAIKRILQNEAKKLQKI